MNTTKRRALSLLAAALMIPALLGGCQKAPAETAQVKAAEEPGAAQPGRAAEARDNGGANKKSETVYVTLDPSGAPYRTIVTDWLHTSAAGSTLADPAGLQDLTLIKGGSLLEARDGEALWQFDDTDLYYSGVTDQPLPLDVSIVYTLDGRAFDPQELAGKSGRLQIDIDLANNLTRPVQVRGKTVEMSAPLTVVLGMALPEDTFSNVEISEEGSVTGDGNNQMAAITAMPGLEKSLALNQYDIPGLDELNFPEHFTITADVTNFELGSVFLACTTGFPDLDIDTQEIDEMDRNINDLKKLENDLEAMDGDRTMRSIFTDQWMTAGAQTLVDDIFEFYDMDKDILDMLPHYVTQRNIDLIDRLRDSAEDVELDQLLFNKNVYALTDFVQTLDEKALRQLLKDAEALEPVLTSSQNLLQNQNGGKLAQDAAALGAAATDPGSQKALSVLLALSGEVLNGSGLENLDALYNASGLGSLSSEQIALFVQGGLEKLAASSGPAPVTLESGDPLTAPPDDAGSDISIGGETTPPAQDGGNSTGTADAPAQGNGGTATPPPAETSGNKSTGETPPPAGDVALVQSDEVDSLALSAGSATQAQAIAGLLTTLQTVKGSSDALLAKEGLTVSELADSTRSLAGNLTPLMKDLADLADDDPAAYRQLLGLMKAFGSDDGYRLLAQLQKDLAANQKNIAAFKKLQEKCDLEMYAKALGSLDGDLLDDLDDALNILDAMGDELEDKNLDRSLHNSPQTVETLLNMRDDLEEYRKVSEALRVTVAPDNAATFQNMIATLDRLAAEGAADKYVGQVADIQELLARKDANVALSQEHSIFTGAPEGYETQLKFIMKTDEIKIPKEKIPVEETDTRPSGLKGLVSSLTGK